MNRFIVNMKFRYYHTKGFTLMEMLFVIVIMSMMAIGFVQYTNQFAQNKLIQKTVVDMQRLLTQAQYFYVLNGQWPSSLNFIEGVSLQSPWPAGSTGTGCNNNSGILQCYQGAQVSGGNYYQVSVTVPSQLIANKIKALLPQGTVNGTEVIAYSAAYGKVPAGWSMEKRIITMDMSYCNSFGVNNKSYFGYNNSGYCTVSYQPPSWGGQYVGFINTDQSSSCPAGDTPVLFPIVGSWDRGANPTYDKKNDFCVADEEIGLYVHPESRGSFSLFPFHATTILSNNSNATYVKNCLTSAPLVFGGLSNGGGSSVFYFSACIPKNAMPSTPTWTQGNPPSSYYQWATPYNVGFYGTGSNGGAYDQNGNYGNQKQPQPLFAP